MTAQELVETIYDWCNENANRPELDISDIDQICNELNWNISKDKIVDFLDENY